MTTLFENSELTPEEFLRVYWQKQPLLLRGALPDFRPELDADDIAGLACEELAESRLITGRFPGGDWTLRHGPFDERDFATLPDRDWTLLVQDVDKHYPPLRRLLRNFGFLPGWRFDDLMVSVAGPGGSVGPHVDQYDVFLLQAAGRRRWQIARSFDPLLQPDCDLNVLQRFEAEQEWTLDPGDLLYLPPGVAHHGVALEQGMTWSIGMRAPSAADLLQSLGEWLAENRAEGPRYGDPQIGPARRCGEVDDDAVGRFSELARAMTGDAREFRLFLGAFLSRYRLAHEPAPPPSSLSRSRLRAALEGGAELSHNPWTRLLWLENEGGALLFAAGAAFECSTETAQTICDEEALRSAGSRWAAEVSGLLLELLNRGHLVLEPL
jgi:50S ribosomal protein L16 3-hydroxylase